MNKKDRDLERQRIMENLNKKIEAREKGDKKVNDSLKLRAIKEYYKFAEDQRKAGAVIDLKFFEKEYERILQQTIEEHKRWLAGEDTREKGDKNVNEPIFKN